MRYLKSVIAGMTMFMLVISFSGLVFAKMEEGEYKEYKDAKWDKEACADKIKTLRNSATALQMSNPGLAKGLNDLADKKAEKMKKWQDLKDEHDANMKLFQDSATALKVSNPDLAQKLQKMSVKEHMEEEAEAKTEPMEEQGEAKY